MACLLPWLALHSAHYFLSHSETGGPYSAILDTPAIFSTAPLFYGSTPAHYTFCFLCVLLVAILGGIAAKNSGSNVRQKAAILIANGGAGMASFLFFTLLLGPQVIGEENAIRYCTPLAIALVPGMLAVAGSIDKFRLSKIVAALGLVVALLFSPSWLQRFSQATNLGSILSFSGLASSPNYLSYCNKTLSLQNKEHVRELQEKIPAGETITAWINAPFNLDFKRNEIFDVDTAGLDNKWVLQAPTPYVMWEYAGYATKTPRDYLTAANMPGPREGSIALRSLKFALLLQTLLKSSQIIYNDGAVAIFHINENEPTQKH
jgi:hypothetical protein